MVAIKRPVNYLEMFPRNIQVAIFGESTHHQQAYKTELMESLPELKRAGFTHLALEMLPFTIQDKLNRRPKNKHLIKDYIMNVWYRGNEGATLSIFKLIDRAHNIGMKIVGLDISLEEYRAIHSQV